MIKWPTLCQAWSCSYTIPSNSWQLFTFPYYVPADPEIGFDPTNKEEHNRHSLSLAASEEGEILEMLLALEKMRYFSEHACTPPVLGPTIIIWCARFNFIVMCIVLSMSCVIVFCRAPKHLNARTGKHDFTPLHYAMLYLRTENVKTLVKHKASTCIINF